MSEAISPTAYDDSLLPSLSAENNYTRGDKSLLMLSQSRNVCPENTCKGKKDEADCCILPPHSSSPPSNNVS